MTNFDNIAWKLYNRPYEEMSLTELYAEQGVHNWHKGRMKYAIQRLQTRSWWLDENFPIVPKEEIQRQYEDGELTVLQRNACLARRQRAINQRMYLEDRMNFAEIIIANEEALIAYLEELKQTLLEKEDANQKKYAAARNKLHPKGRGYDPRKRASKYNQNPLHKTQDPNRKWATRTPYKPMPQLQRARARWKQARKDDQVVNQVRKHMQPIMTWDVGKLRQIAKDRGYYTDIAMVSQIADKLNITISGANKLISGGKLSWSQCIVIGALFEMTPKEFCDTFMSGYFREVADGVYKAYVEDFDALLDKPYKAKSRKVSESEDGQNDGE